MVNSINIFWYLLGKMSTPKSKQINSVNDFLELLQQKIDANVQLGTNVASSIAIRIFRMSVNEESSDQPEQQELNDIRQKIFQLKEIKTQVLKFLEKLSNSNELNPDELKLSRILCLYISLCYKSLEFVKELNVLLEEISQSNDMLKVLEQETETCETRATKSFIQMIDQLRIIKPSRVDWTPPSNKHKKGRPITTEPEFRQMTSDERQQLVEQEGKSTCAIKVITMYVEERLKNLEAFSRKLNECISRFNQISETFKSLVGNISFFDFTMSLFQGQIEEARFSDVSINHQTLYLSLQTEREKLVQYLKEITIFKEEKERANRLRDQEKIQFVQTTHQSCLDWVTRKQLENNQ